MARTEKSSGSDLIRRFLQQINCRYFRLITASLSLSLAVGFTQYRKDLTNVAIRSRLNGILHFH